MNRVMWRTVLAVALLAIVPALQGAAPETKRPFRIIAFGDSLTSAYNLGDPEKRAWPVLLENKLRAKGFDVEVVNAGVSGETTFNALARLDYTLSQGGDLVIVEFGSNDIFQGKTLTNIEKNLDDIVRRIRAKKMGVVLCALKTFPNYGKEYGGDYEKIFPRVAARHGIPLAPFFLAGVAGHPELNLADGIHPNAQGHVMMADTIFPTIEKALRSMGR